MGEATDQTRLAIDAQRAQLTDTAAQLRDAVDLPKKFKENPLPFVAVGAGALFLLAGGPMRLARLVRRRVAPSRTERAYDGLPKTLQKWVDEIAGGIGPRTEEARESLASEFVRWRHDPKREKKFQKELARHMVEGPPGASRTAWKAIEAGAAILTAALARKAVEQFLAGEPPSGLPALDAAGTVGGAAKPDEHPARAGLPGEQPAEGYSSMSGSSRG